MELIWLALLATLGLGYLAQTTALCLVKGVAQALVGKPLFMAAILLSGCLSWLPLLFAARFDLSLPFSRDAIGWVGLLGGFIFGLGAAANSGCGLSTISRLCRGQLLMLATISGWLIGWLLLAQFSAADVPSTKALNRLAHKPELIEPGSIERWHIASLMLISALAMVYIMYLKPPQRRSFLLILLLGLLASIAFFYRPNWPPSNVLQDTSLAIYASQFPWPSIERLLLIVAMLLGMLVAALRYQLFALQGANARQLLRNLLAGVLMGGGAAMAGGGNDVQLLLALPAFSPAGFATIVMMLVGIFVGLKWLGDGVYKSQNQGESQGQSPHRLK